MTTSNQPLEPTPTDSENTQAESSSPKSREPMQEYYQLVRTLFLITLGFTGIITGSVWFFYSLKVALNYLLGAATGVVYLRMLAKDVEQLGQQQQRLGLRGLALFTGLIIIASQWQQLNILPIFLGFMTYKVAIFVYMLLPSFGDSTKVQ